MNAPRSLTARVRNRLALTDRTRRAPNRLGRALASFTFDDFPVSALTIGGRMLEAAGARGTFFVCGSLMGQVENGMKLFETAHLKAAHGAGHEIGSHAFDHQPLGARGVRFALESCARNDGFVRDVLGPEAVMTSFAYPFGDASLGVKAALARRFALCRGVYRAVNAGAPDLAQIDVVSLELRHAGETDIKAIVADAKTRNAWIVFMTHEVEDAASPFGATPAMLADAIRCVREAEVPILPLKAAAAQIVFGAGASPAP
jgi:peptidoglycan/xylan/chitin deacetylase (PgdA/CDA1 family)